MSGTMKFILSTVTVAAIATMGMAASDALYPPTGDQTNKVCVCM